MLAILRDVKPDYHIKELVQLLQHPGTLIKSFKSSMKRHSYGLRVFSVARNNLRPHRVGDRLEERGLEADRDHREGRYSSAQGGVDVGEASLGKSGLEGHFGNEEEMTWGGRSLKTHLSPYHHTDYHVEHLCAVHSLDLWPHPLAGAPNGTQKSNVGDLAHIGWRHLIPCPGTPVLSQWTQCTVRGARTMRLDADGFASVLDGDFEEPAFLSPRPGCARTIGPDRPPAPLVRHIGSTITHSRVRFAQVLLHSSGSVDTETS
ncbi:hypothetical protein DFH09DRAFT_1412779 [Mycena vulgaris]|nr:hypothetical protein DFH09DRAFT_1412779 [Mycena vulgaris]